MTVTNCLSTWFPLVEAAGLPVPRTEIVRWQGEHLICLFDGKEPDGFSLFISALEEAAVRVNCCRPGPVFLRTGQGSGKHNWRECCHVADVGRLREHVMRLVEWSECVDFLGLPTDVWAVRELLPTTPLLVCDRYGGMPVCREFRYFVRDGDVVCWHPYWPFEALLDGLSERPVGFDQLYRALSYQPAVDGPVLRELACRAGRAGGGGYWSVDLLETRRGWFLTDMALGEDSWHWPGCPGAVAGPPRGEVTP